MFLVESPIYTSSTTIARSEFKIWPSPCKLPLLNCKFNQFLDRIFLNFRCSVVGAMDAMTIDDLTFTVAVMNKTNDRVKVLDLTVMTLGAVSYKSQLPYFSESLENELLFGFDTILRGIYCPFSKDARPGSWTTPIRDDRYYDELLNRSRAETATTTTTAV